MDEVSDTVAFCEAEIIVSVGIHLIRLVPRHRLAAARSHFGSGIINAIHYRNAASLPLRGRLGNEILAGEVKSSTKMKSDFVRLNVSPIPTLTHA